MGGRQIIERFGPDFLRCASENIINGRRPSEDDGREWRQSREAMPSKIPLRPALRGRFKQIPNSQRGIVFEMAQAESRMQKSNRPRA